MLGLDPWLNKLAIDRINRLHKPFNVSQSVPFSQFQTWTSKPNWISLSTPEHFEQAARSNPIVKAAINLLATSASNGKKVAVDIKTGDIIPWTENDKAIQKARQLLVLRPNPIQSFKEFAHQGVFYIKVFGNRYVYANMPIGFNEGEIDLLDVETLINLPSQFVNIRTTGKLYEQTTLEGIIEKYAVTNIQPTKEYNANEVLHFNEVNISSEMASIMGISKLEVLKMPITNTQRAFEAMNTLLTSRGMQGIISPKKIDGTGASIPLTTEEKKSVDATFKTDYGLLNNQNPFLITPVPLDFVKTIMNSKDLGIYEEFSNNAIIISNEFGVPPELVKTYIKGATYENQIQSVRRLYQDTTIPMVEDEDLYWSYRLNTYEYGFEIQTRWDHIPAMQDAFKEKAAALSLKGRTAKDAYDNNIITWNQYLTMLDFKPVDGGDVYKFERKLDNGENE